MKICFMGDGNSVHIKRWLNYFKDRGHEVHLITFSEVKNCDVQIHKIGNFEINPNGGNWKYLLSSFEVAMAIKEIKPDLINAHYITSYGFIGALTGFKPLVLTAWGSDVLVSAKASTPYRLITRFALGRAALVTSESDFLSKEVRSLSKTKVITVPMGIESQILGMTREENNKDEVRILSLRTVNKNSNIDIIIKGFSKVVERNSNTKFKLILTNDGTEMGNIKSLIKELGLEDNVEVRGLVPRDELLKLMLSSDIHITIPTSDSTSVTLLEAMACGITNIVSNIPSNLEWIKDKYNGIVLEKFDCESLASCIEEASHNKELQESSRKLNREIIKDRAIWEDNMGFVETEFLDLIK